MQISTRNSEKHTRIICHESYSSPPLLRNFHSVHKRWIHQIVPFRVSLFVEISNSGSDDVEAMPMKMHWMSLRIIQDISPLEHYLHCFIIFQNLHLSSLHWQCSINRQILLCVVIRTRRIVWEICFINFTNIPALGFNQIPDKTILHNKQNISTYL